MQKKQKARTLIFDIETMPNLVRTWRKWEQNAIWYERYGYLWSISWKWLGEKQVYHKNITDFPLYKKDKYSDKALVDCIWKLMDTADIVVAHNGNAFDTKTIVGRFVHHRLPPPSPYKKVDTKLLYRMYLNEDSNSLKDIAKKHGLPQKLDTGGYELWQKCENGEKKAIKEMKDYNNGDVVTLEAAYMLILPYIVNHPNIGVLIGERSVCPNCGSSNLQSRGVKWGKRWWFCNDCRSWHKSALKDNSQIT